MLPTGSESINDSSNLADKVRRFVKKQPFLMLGILFIVSLTLSSLLAIFIAYPRGAGTDGAFYALSGANLFMGNGYTYSDVPNTFTWPLFSIGIGFVNLILDDLQLSGHVILVLSFSLSIFPFYYTARNLFDEKTAMIAAFLFSLNGFLIRLSGRFLPETLLVFCLISAIFFVSRILKDTRESSPIRVFDWVLAGFFFGLSYLTKPEAFQYFILSWICLFILTRKQNRNYLFSAVLMFFVFAITIFPQIHFIHEQTGKWQLATYNRFLFRGYTEPMVSLSPGEPAKDPHIEYNYNAYIVRGSYTSDQFQNDLSRLPSHSVKYFKSFMTIIGPLHILLLILSFFLYDKKKQISRLYIYLLLVPVVTLFLWYAPVDRHFIVFIPFFILLSSSVITELSPHPFNYRNYPVAGAFLLLFIQSYTPIANQSPTNAVIGNHQKLGEWMRENLPDIKGKLIADRKPYVTFLVQGRYFRYNKIRDSGSLLIELKKRNVDYLIVDDFYTRTKNPAIIELLDGKDRQELKFIHSVEDARWGKAILYKIK